MLDQHELSAMVSWAAQARQLSACCGLSSEDELAPVNERPNQEPDPGGDAHDDQDAGSEDERQGPEQDGGNDAEAGDEHQSPLPQTLTPRFTTPTSTTKLQTSRRSTTRSSLGTSAAARQSLLATCDLS